MNYKNYFSLNKKLIFLLGGNGLIGNEIKKGLIDNGAKVVAIDKYQKKNNTSKSLFYERVDASNLKSLKKIINKIVSKYGCPDGFINCSYPKTKDWPKNNYKQIKLNSFLKNVEIHMAGQIWIAKIIADHMSKRKQGSIVQFGSIYGSLAQDDKLYLGTNIKESMSYTSIKGGILNSVKSMASYYGKNNLRVNSISPGGVKDNQNKKFIRRYEKRTPMRRMANPDDIVGAVIFLISDASAYVTGLDLKVDGGWSII